MTALRQQAYDLLDALPEGQLVLVVDILAAFKRNEDSVRRRSANDPASRQSGEETFIASRFGIAEGKLLPPDDIDSANEEIADLFEGNL